MQKYVNLIAFHWKLISKDHVVVIMEFPDWVQVKIYITHFGCREDLVSASLSSQNR